MIARTTIVAVLLGTFALAAGQEVTVDFVGALVATPDGGRSIGLHKLTPDERAALNVVLNRIYILGREGSPPVSAVQSGQAARAPAASSRSAYVTKIESDSNSVLKLTNGGIVEVTSGFLGFLGFRKDAVLLVSGSTCRVWIEGKRTYRCSVLRAPSAKPVDVVLTSITEVSRGGDIIKTLDGSLYEVSSLHTIYTSLWLPVSEVAVLGGSQMLNLDQGDEIITVVRLK